MKINCLFSSISLAVACAAISAAGAEIIIHVDKPGAAVSPTLDGAFFEDINHAGDGGLYASPMLFAAAGLKKDSGEVRSKLRSSGGNEAQTEENMEPPDVGCYGMEAGSGDLILKVVNRGSQPESVNLHLPGLAEKYGRGTCTELSAESLTDENSFAQPKKVSPTVSALPAFNQGCNHVFPPYSVTVLRWSKNIAYWNE